MYLDDYDLYAIIVMMIMSCKVFLIIEFVETYFLSVYLYDDRDDNNNDEDNDQN
jgi:heme/copper-type cytochrome/quinol oxidase subunit 2